MNKWVMNSIADIGEVVGGSTPSTKNDNYYGGGIAWITPKDLSNFSYRYIANGARNITIDGLNSCSSKIIPKNSILFSSRAPIGYIAIAENELCTNQGFKSVIPNSKINYMFLYYLLKYKKDEIEALASGTTFKEVSGAVMKKFEFLMPSNVSEQATIAATLSSLDDKIELNNRINKTLEEMAQAIFKSWFVDFEPWGEVMPKNWEVGTIADLGAVVGGSTPSKAKPEYYAKHGIAWITPKDLSVNKNKFINHGADDITELGLRNSSTHIVPRGTVLFSSRAPIGYIAIANGEVCTNQGFKSIIPNESIGTAYVYFYLKNNIQIIEGMASGSTFKEVSGSVMKGIPAIIPDVNTLNRFMEVCAPIFEQQEHLEWENSLLTAIRDTLLPKLMSGEIRVETEEMA